MENENVDKKERVSRSVSSDLFDIRLQREADTPETRAIRVVNEWLNDEDQAHANLMIAIADEIREAVKANTKKITKEIYDSTRAKTNTRANKF